MVTKIIACSFNSQPVIVPKKRLQMTADSTVLVVNVYSVNYKNVYT